MSASQKLTTEKQNQLAILLKRVAESKRRHAFRGVPLGGDGAMIANGLESLEPKFSYYPNHWIRAACLAYRCDLKIEDLAQWSDQEILHQPNIGKGMLGWLRENYPADYVASR